MERKITFLHRFAWPYLFFFFLFGPSLAHAGKFLFDASKQEMAGNADWVIDADQWDYYLEHYPCGVFANESNPQALPTPDQSTITSTTGETYWTGGISAWAIDLVKAGHQVSTLPPGSQITYQDPANPYDLSNYDVFIIPEPQNPFTPSERTAILNFVNDGGGLFLVADHQTSDRNCSGWDSPHIFNDLMGVVISGGTITDYGVFGFVFNVQEISGLTNTDYWFDDAVDNNVSTDPADPIIHGPFGDGSGGLGLFGSTSMTMNPSANPTVRGHIWKTDAGGQGNTRVTFITVQYGNGRVAAIGDSSPADDGTGDSGDTLYPGWDKASGGVANDIIFLNACHWLLYGNDTTPPVITSGPVASPYDCSATITWTTDEASNSFVEYGLTTSYGSSTSDSSYVTNHSLSIVSLSPNTTYHYRVASTDRVGNGPTYSGDATFTTSAGASPVITSGPQATNVTGTSATILWTTDEPSDSTVEYGLTSSYGNTTSNSALVTQHQVQLTGLTPNTTYHYRVLSTDGCGQGPTISSDFQFTTGPAEKDISGWTLYQYGGNASYTFPPGTKIPSGGYIIVARNVDQTSFETCWGPLPADVLFLNSNANGSCGTTGCLPIINGGESYELKDTTNGTVDGVTITGGQNNAYQRTSPTAPAGQTSSWTVVSMSQANPGSGMTPEGSDNVIISEWSDSSDYTCEFVELFYDGGASTPDTTPPADVTDLTATPLNESTIRITFTAVGDDGTSGTASTYDLRYSLSPIRNLTDFQNATQVAGEPSPQASGAGETIDVTGLQADTSYYFVLRVADEVPNWSGLSNNASATTMPQSQGGGSAVDVSGWRVHQNNSTIDWTIPAGTIIPAQGYLIIARNVDQATFESFYGMTCDPATCVFLNSNANGSCDGTNGCIPLINGGESYALYDSSNALVDGTTITLPSTHQSVQRSDPCGPANSSASWTSVPETSTNPGSGISNPGQCGVLISEFSDASSYAYEFIEIFNDSAGQNPGNVGNTLLAQSKTMFLWGTAGKADGYRLRRGTAPDFMNTPPAPLYEGPDQFYDDVTIPNTGEVLFYFVTAYNTTGESTN